MSCISYFTPAPDKEELPQELSSPFWNIPHPLAKRASEQLQQRLTNQIAWQHDFTSSGGGKMFGVLVVKDANNQIGFLSAFSGTLAGQWELPGFVPPVFDRAKQGAVLHDGEVELAGYLLQLKTLQESDEYQALLSEFEDLLIQQKQELNTLAEIHKTKKALRREKREAARGWRKADKEKLFAKLALESQNNKHERQAASKKWHETLVDIQSRLDQYNGQIETLKKIHSKKYTELRKKQFTTTIGNMLGEQKPIVEFFKDATPPIGTGDCVAPKLIHYANQHGMTPLALAEFWWGASPADEIRHHGHFYPACRGRCHPILPFMLKGFEVQPRPIPIENHHANDDLVIIYEDEDLLVVNKPYGMLSVPGKEIKDSVHTRLQQRYPEASGPLLVHRLDMATSGLLLVAKNARTHKALQRQFIKRSIEKRYEAVLSKSLPHEETGIIELPLRTDFNDRPRQLVCFTHGKPATTRWEVIEREEGRTRVYFYPVTGRTHQIRMHAAHKNGLNAPIVGDRLYGKADERLLLHAQRLCFTHPATGKRIELEAPTPF